MLVWFTRLEANATGPTPGDTHGVTTSQFACIVHNLGHPRRGKWDNGHPDPHIHMPCGTHAHNDQINLIFNMIYVVNKTQK